MEPDVLNEVCAKADAAESRKRNLPKPTRSVKTNFSRHR